MVLNLMKPSQNFNRGLTLIELLVAISLSALVGTLAMGLFKNAGHALKLSNSRLTVGSLAQAQFSSLSENLLAGGGLLFLGENRLILLNAHQRKIEYQWQDSILSLNGKPLPLRLGLLKIEPEGPNRPLKSDWNNSLDTPWTLDSLDQDRDGKIDFKELDRDGNGELDAEECLYVGRTTITMTIVDQNILYTQSVAVHPRNHLIALSKKKWGIDPEAAGNAGF